jgi:orotidine-5'-phosphate decarboxylase
MRSEQKAYVKPKGRARILVALDVPLLDEAAAIARELSAEVGGFKVGLELLTQEGSLRVVELLRRFDRPLFYDGKFNDIPRTCGQAAAAVSRLGVWMFDVHASAGSAALREAAANRGDALVVAVTVLTSLDSRETRELFGTETTRKVLQFAQLAARNQIDGVVCAPTDLLTIKEDREASTLLTVVPGIRPTWAATGDQVRIATPSGAVGAGADYLVIGRPILQPPPGIGGRREAARRIVEEIEEAERGLTL